MALLPTWEQHNYEQNIRKISTKQYEEMVNDVRDMLWPHRDKIQAVGDIFTYVPFAKSISGRDTRLQCSIHYENGHLDMSFQSANGYCDHLFDMNVSKKLFGLRTESKFSDDLYKFSPEFMKTAISQVLHSYTKEEKAEMFREANLKSSPDTFTYDISMVEHCQMMSLNEIRDTMDYSTSGYVIYLNGGKFDILHAHEFRFAQDVLNVMVSGEYIRPRHIEMTPTPVTACNCKSLTEVADSITQSLVDSKDFKKGLDDLNDLIMDK